ncbi:hypothetical protein OG921_04820 [Aldersonia sp. NBC_00410]|uniref:hypothetical protein n=1 Tax=Aldersonia sp. NBC_00410 TaxID=2975954 RepID=UPI002253B58F|nr:hypothetical protein [Aldersonia sp. NBC_00410]MCX5042495.1 hypothetical protein [Aldersonia sp. NBC_00410]
MTTTIRARPRPRARGLATLAAATLAVLVLGATSGCGNDNPTPAPPAASMVAGEQGNDAHTPLPDPLADVTSAPGRTAEQALAAMFSWQPATDPGPAAAVARALPYLGGQLAAAATVTLDAPLLPAQWAAWSRSHDTITAAATTRDTDPRSTETATEATQVVDVRQIVLHANGQATPLPAMVAIAELDHTADGWRLVDYRLTGQ